MMVVSVCGRWRLMAYFLCCLACVVALFGCPEEAPPPEVIRAIKWTKVQQTTTQQVRMISGTTKPVDQTLLSFAVGGTVEKVSAKLGDRVKKEQILAELDQQPFMLALREAQADLSKAQASVVERQANFERVSKLYASDNASKADLDEARASYNSAQSQQKAAEAQVGLARRDLNKTALRAPFNGAISRKEVEPHMEVRQGQAVFALDGEESGYEVRTAVPENLVIRLQAGETVEVVFPGLRNRRVKGTITEIGSRSETASTYPVTVKLQETFAEFRAGMSVEVAFEFIPQGKSGEPVAEGLIVPIAALLIGTEETRFVFVYDEKSSTVKKTPVKTINLRDNDVLVEPNSLKAGDIIATAGVPFLTDGQRVTLMKEAKPDRRARGN